MSYMWSILIGFSEGICILIGSHSHKFMSIRLQDGVVIWSTTVGGRIEATAAVSSQHGVVFVGQ